MSVVTLETPAAPLPPARPAVVVLTLVWLGQLLSVLTQSLTSFGMSIWVYQNSGSILQFAATMVFAVVPSLLAAPWAGSVADRYDRRRIVIAADAVILAGMAAVALMLWAGKLDLWHVYANNALGSLCMAFRRPAYMAGMTMIAPKKQLARYSGMMGMAESMASTTAPLLAGLLLTVLGLPLLIALNFPAFLLAIVALLMLRWPDAVPGPDAGKRSALRDFGEALRFLGGDRRLLLLTCYSALLCFLLGMVMMLYRPMLLGTHTPAVVGMIQSAGGLGIFAATSLLALLSPDRRLVLLVLLADTLFGFALILCGVAVWVPFACVAMLSSTLFERVASSCLQTFWQRKVPPHLQGRVFALNGMIAVSSMPVAAIAGGLLADHVFEPWLMPGGLLSGSVGLLIGTGTGHGIRFMVVVTGVLIMALGTLMLAQPEFRRLDQALPDAH